MTADSPTLGIAGLFALFAPDILLTTFDASPTTPLAVPVQLMRSLYFAFALINWTARDSAIGGIYARPVSLGNFAHFFAVLFYRLVFRATGLPKEKVAQKQFNPYD